MPRIYTILGLSLGAWSVFAVPFLIRALFG